MPRLSTQRLTETRIQRAKFQAASAKTELSHEWDSEIRGFGLRITRHGSKSFVLKFMSPSGQQAWMSLGAYLDGGSLTAARDRAIAARQLIDSGRDPRVEAKKQRALPTVAEYSKTFLEEQRGKVQPSTFKEIETALTKIVVPVLGRIRVRDVERVEVEDLFRKVSNGWRPGKSISKDTTRATPILANRLLAYLGKMFSVAERRGFRAQGTNPCRLIPKNQESHGRQRYLTPLEIEWLGRVMKEAPDWHNEGGSAKGYAKDLLIPSAFAIFAIQLLILTGARVNEILSLRWSQVDFSRGVLKLSQHKTMKTTGTKELPINDSVEGVLRHLQSLEVPQLGADWVIPGHRFGCHMVNIQKPWQSIRKAVHLASGGSVNIDDVRLHDLRHTFASFGASNGESLPMLGSLLGHTQASTTQRYAHLFVDPRKEASDRISGKIAERLFGTTMA